MSPEGSSPSRLLVSATPTGIPAPACGIVEGIAVLIGFWRIHPGGHDRGGAHDSVGGTAAGELEFVHHEVALQGLAAPAHRQHRRRGVDGAGPQSLHARSAERQGLRIIAGLEDDDAGVWSGRGGGELDRTAAAQVDRPERPAGRWVITAGVIDQDAAGADDAVATADRESAARNLVDAGVEGQLVLPETVIWL